MPGAAGLSDTLEYPESENSSRFVATNADCQLWSYRHKAR